MDNKVLIAVVAVVVLAAAGGGAALLLNNGHNGTSDSSILNIDSPGTYTGGEYEKVIIGAGVGDGDVTLKGVKILKELIIRGGGSHSVTMEDSDASQARTSIEKEEGETPRVNLINSQLGETDVTGRAIIEGDANSKVQSVTADGASVTFQGENTKVEEVKATGNTSVNITGGSVTTVEAVSSTVTVSGQSTTVSSVKATENTTVSVTSGNVTNVDASGSTVNVAGENATIENLDLSGQSAVSVQNGTVDSMNMQKDSQVSLEVGADGTLQSVTYSDNVAITTTGTNTEDKLAESDQKMAEGASTSDVSVNGQNQHIHRYTILINADWSTLDRANKTVTATVACEICDENADGHEVTKTVALRENVEQVTCESGGYTVYFIISIPGHNGSPRYDEVPALGHDYEKTCTWNEGHGSATIKFVCRHDSTHTVEFVTQDVQTQVTEPTCTEKGRTVYTVSGDRDGVSYEFTDTIESDALGHDFGPQQVDWSRLNTQRKTVQIVGYCSRDHNHKLVGEVPVTERVIEPTCTEGGYTVYFTDIPGDNGSPRYSETPALGHEYGPVQFTWSDDNTECTATKTCSRCGHELTENAQVQREVLTEADVGVEGSVRYTAVFESYDPQVKIVPIPMLDGFTVTVYGGKVAKQGQEPTRTSITVAENTVVTVSQPGDGFTFWTDDYGDYIPGESFDILVTCDLYVTAHYEDDFVYGDWVQETEQTCTQDGLWYRESGDMREYRIMPALGHESDGNLVIDTPATCTAEGSGHTLCTRCHEEIEESIPATGHHYEFEVQSEASGPTVGEMRGVCSECGDVTVKEYISPTIPFGNITVTFDWSHVRDITTADRDETHTMWTYTDGQGVDRLAYLYQIQRDIHRNGYIHGMDVTSWFFWVDYGEHSPVYVARHNESTPVYGGANNSASWAIAGYVDNVSEFIRLIDNLSVEVTMDGEETYLGLGLDNGSNASALFDLYSAWANVFNSGRAGQYQVDHTTYLGWECTVYYNEDESFYVNENNCCVRWSRSDMWNGIEHGDTLKIVSVDDDFTKPFTQGYWNSNDFPQFSSYYFNNMPTLENSTYFCVKLINGSYNSGDFTMGNVRTNFFNGDSRDLVMWIEPNLPRHTQLTSIEVLDKDGAWTAVPYVKVDGHYEFNIQDRTINGLYRYMMESNPDKFVMPNDPAFNGVYIRCVMSPIQPDSTVTVVGGTFTDEAGDELSVGAVYGGDSISLTFEEIEDKRLTGINVKVGDGDVQFTDRYWYYLVPEASSVTIQPVYENRQGDKVRIDFVCTSGGSVDDRSGMYYVDDYVDCMSFPDYGYIFVGWYDVTDGSEPCNENQCGWSSCMNVYVQRASVYKAVFAPIDASILAEDYTIILATGGFIHWEGKPVYLSALYGSTEYCEDRINTHANPNLEPVHRWDMVSNLEKVEGELVNGDTLTPQFPSEPDEEFDVKYSGDYTTVNAIFESEVEYCDVTVYDCGDVYQRLSVASDVPYYAPEAPRDREGYDFAGWNTAEDGSGTGYDAGDDVEVTGDLVLYAQWEAKVFRTSINVEGLSYQFYNINNPYGGVYILVTYGQTAAIPADLAILYGATLTGWYYMQDEQKVPVAADGTGTIPYGISGIYAEFEYREYTMTFDKGAEDATGTMQNVTFTIEDLTDEITYFSYPIRNITFERTAYNLSKWSFNETTLGSSYSSVRISKTTFQQADENGGVINLVAVWGAKDYYVKYSKGDAQGQTILGTLPSGSSAVKADAPLTLNTGSQLSATGMTFIGWNTSEDGTGRQYAPGESVGLEFIIANYPQQVTTITLYGQWAKSNYGITFHGPNDASSITSNTYFAYNTPNALPLVSTMGAGFAVDGYTFLYWTDDPQGQYGERYADGEAVSALTRTGTFDLYGVWAPNTYTVVFDANGGEGVMDDQTFEVNETEALKANAYTLDGHHFEHWCDVDYNQGAYFADQQQVKNLCEYGVLTDHKLASTVTLYAIWYENQ